MSEEQSTAPLSPVPKANLEEVEKFDKAKLRQVDIAEKTALPSKEGK